MLTYELLGAMYKIAGSRKIEKSIGALSGDMKTWKDPEQPSPPSSIVFHAHCPERRRNNAQTVCCGCSCCCCCLHSLGGLVGAAISSAKATEPEQRSACTIYWISLCVCTLAAGALSDSNTMIIILAMAMPLVQLAATVISVVIAALMGSTGTGRLGKIFWGSLLGVVAGIGAMALFLPFLK